jgi:hypothetical protein
MGLKNILSNLKEQILYWVSTINAKPLLITRRENPSPHYEVHYDHRVEFRKLDGTKWGSSRIWKVNENGER